MSEEAPPAGEEPPVTDDGNRRPSNGPGAAVVSFQKVQEDGTVSNSHVPESETTPEAAAAEAEAPEAEGEADQELPPADAPEGEEEAKEVEAELAEASNEAEQAAEQAEEAAAEAAEAANDAQEAAEMAAMAPREEAMAAAEVAVAAAETAQELALAAGQAADTADEARRNAAAIRIQARQRGIVTRKRNQGGGNGAEPHDTAAATVAAEGAAESAAQSAAVAMDAAMAAKEAAAVKIQSVHRGGRARQGVHTKRVEAEAARRQRAAVAIQRGARGRNARNRTRSLRGGQALSRDDISAMEEEEALLQAQHDAIMQEQMLTRSRELAALRIQALQRGRAGRYKSKQKRMDQMEQRARFAVPPGPPSGRPRPIAVTPPRAEHVSAEERQAGGPIHSPIAQQLQHKLSVVRGEIDGLQQQIVQCLTSLDDSALAMVTQLNAQVDNLVKIERQVAIAIEHRQRLEVPAAPPPQENLKAVRFVGEPSPTLTAQSGNSVGGLAPLQGPGVSNHHAMQHEHSRARLASGGSRYSDSEGGTGGMSHRERLIAFYRQHNPAMLDKTDAILAKYRGHEEVLFHKLARKYAVSAGDDSAKPVWDNTRGNKKRSISDISGKSRANEVSAQQKQGMRNTEQNVMGRLLRNQIELENRVSRMQPNGNNGLW